MNWKGLINAYCSFLPVTDQTPIITLHEGNTILLPATGLSERLKIQLFLKFEGQHPTGSFKDRGMTLAVSKAVESGSRAVMCASTGNTSASAAAYAARAGIKCIVLVPDGYIALGKLAQALIYGAEVIAIKGNFDAALQLVRKITQEHPITLVEEGFFKPGARVVCIMTGHGLKDPDTAIQTCHLKPKVIPAQEDAVLEILNSYDIL
jgi:threonine synthase